MLVFVWSWFPAVVIGFPACELSGAPGPGCGIGVRSSGLWDRECGQPAEGGGEGVCPGPVVLDAPPGSALAVGDAGGGVQQPVAQGLGFGPGEIGVVG